MSPDSTRSAMQRKIDALTLFGLGLKGPLPAAWATAPAAMIALALALADVPVLAGFIAMTLIIVAGTVPRIAFARTAAERFGSATAPQVVCGKLAWTAFPIAEVFYYQGGFAKMALGIAIAWAYYLALDTTNPWPFSALRKLGPRWSTLRDVLIGVAAIVAFNLTTSVLKQLTN